MLLVTAVLLMLFVLPTGLGVALVALALVAEIGELVLWRKVLDRYRVVTGAEGLVGERGVVAGACAPEGTVRVHGELWRARAAVPLARGERVRVTAVDGLTLAVEPDGDRGAGGHRMAAAPQTKRGEG